MRDAIKNNWGIVFGLILPIFMVFILIFVATTHRMLSKEEPAMVVGEINPYLIEKNDCEEKAKKQLNAKRVITYTYTNNDEGIYDCYAIGLEKIDTDYSIVKLKE